MELIKIGDITYKSTRNQLIRRSYSFKSTAQLIFIIRYQSNRFDSWINSYTLLIHFRKTFGKSN